MLILEPFWTNQEICLPYLEPKPKSHKELATNPASATI